MPPVLLPGGESRTLCPHVQVLNFGFGVGDRDLAVSLEEQSAHFVLLGDTLLFWGKRL